MGFLSRIKSILGAKIEKGLDKWEDPKEMLDYSIVEMEKSLREMTKNTVEIATAKKKLERQRDVNLANATNYQQLAERAVSLGQEGLAKDALIKKTEEEARANKLQEQINALDANLNTITQSKKELQHKIEIYRAKKEELKAVYDASKAQLKVKEIMTSLGNDSKNIAETIDRAESKIKDTEAKVAALNDLIDQGVVEEFFPDKKDDIDKRLSQLTKDTAVDEELAKLKEKVANNRQEG